MKISKQKTKTNNFSSNVQFNQNCVNEIIKGEIAKKENFTLLLKGKKEESQSPFASYKVKANFKPKKIAKPYMKPIKQHPFIVDYQSKIKLFYRTNELEPFLVNSFEFVNNKNILTISNEDNFDVNYSERYQVNSTESVSINSERIRNLKKSTFNIIELLTKEEMKKKSKLKNKKQIKKTFKDSNRHIMIEDNSSGVNSFSPINTNRSSFFNHSSIYHNLLHE